MKVLAALYGKGKRGLTMYLVTVRDLEIDVNIAFRVILDIASDPSILRGEWSIGDKFIVAAAEVMPHVDPMTVEAVMVSATMRETGQVYTVKAILSQLLPNIRYPATRASDVYLIADGLVVSSDKCEKVE